MFSSYLAIKNRERGNIKEEKRENETDRFV